MVIGNPTRLFSRLGSHVSSGCRSPETIRHLAAPRVRVVVARAKSSGVSELVVPKQEVIRFIEDCLCRVGTSKEDAFTVAHHLFTADYRGHFSHGMNRMKMYVMEIKNKLTDPVAKPEVVTDFKAIALVDGQNALGAVVGKYCMQLAMAKAEEFGVGVVSARGSNHYGICGYYTKMAIEENLIGFTCTNTSPLMAPTGSKKAALGTNPISLGMGAQDGEEFVLDMATTTVALGKIELASRKGESIPEGWALDSKGKATTDPRLAYEAACLLPLGGDERNSGYKGYGLALMVEVLCGILSGSKFGPNIRGWQKSQEIANLGQFFMAIDPCAFDCTAGFQDRLSKLLRQLRSLPMAGANPVLVHGDSERLAMEKVNRDGGISYHPNQLKDSKEFARQMDVEPMKLIPKRSC